MHDRKKTGDFARLRGAALLAMLALLLPGAALAGDVEFYATADQDEIGIDDTVTLTVTATVNQSGNGDEGDVRLPTSPDFETLSRSQSQQMSFSMGSGGPPSFRKTRVFTLVLQPKRTGTLTIHPGRLVVRGKAYETGALQIRVLKGTTGHKRPSRPPPSAQRGHNPFGLFGGMLGEDEDAQDLLNQFFGGSRPTSDSDLYLRTYIDKKQAFLGEQVTFSTYLFSRVEVSGVDGLKMPRLDGFWAEDLETPQQITGDVKMIDGVPYRVFLLRKRALFPIKSGKLTIEPVDVEVSTGLGLVLSGRRIKRTSQPLTLEVLPLPPGAPAGFEASNVGAWTLAAETSPSLTSLGQPITLKVTLSGTGNLHDIVAPKLPPIPGFKVYDPTVNEKDAISGGRFGGQRVLEYLMMPEQTGLFEVPSLTLHYFDPASRAYKTSTTDPISLRVETGAGAVASAGNGAAGASASPDRPMNVLDQGALRPLRFKGELFRPQPSIYRRPWFVPLALSPFLLWVGIGIVGLVRSTLRPSADGAQRGRARKRLKAASALLKAGKPDPFYAELSRSLNEYLSARLGVPVGGLTRADLSARLSEAGLEAQAIASLCAVLDACDAGRFAPGGSSRAHMEKLLGTAAAAMDWLDAARLAAPAQEATP